MGKCKCYLKMFQIISIFLAPMKLTLHEYLSCNGQAFYFPLSLFLPLFLSPFRFRDLCAWILLSPFACSFAPRRYPTLSLRTPAVFTHRHVYMENLHRVIISRPSFRRLYTDLTPTLVPFSLVRSTVSSLETR